MSAAETREAAALESGSARLGVALPEGALAKLEAYLALLAKWNRTYNLTAIREPERMVTHHALDSLAVVPRLPQRKGIAVLDVGSGGGLPGIVVAILEPAWDVTCVDAVAKKAAFLRQCAGTLRLPNLHVEHARVEQLRAAAFDVVTARAFASLADLVRLTAQLLAPGGVWVAMKGRVPHDEIAALPPDIDVFHVEPLAVPGLDAERCLVWMRRRDND